MSIPINPQKREWMKEIRKDKEMNVREIAETLGISHQHYSKIENGYRNPSIELSASMAEFFGVPIERLLEDRTKFLRENKF